MNILSRPLTFLVAGLLFFSSCGEPPAPPIEADIEVSNFGAIDQNGDFHSLFYYSDAKAIVLYIHGNACPIVRNGIADIKAVRDQFKDKDVVFLMLNSNLQDDRDAIAKEAKEFGIDFPILVDDNQLIGESLGLHRTAEVLIIQPKSWEILYRGPVNDRMGYESQKNEAKNNYLADNLNTVLAGGEIAENVIKGKGCLIKFANKDLAAHANISYEKEIAPMLLDNCVRCHSEGGIAPWAMNSYETVFGWSAMIREVLRTKRMPPWQADPHYGKFANDISLSKEEVQKLVHWVEAGSPKDSENDPLKAYEPKAAVWELGEPDIIVQLEPETIPATGIIDYRYQEHVIPIDEDVYARAIQVIPGNTSVLHHLLVSITYPDGFELPIVQKSRWLDGLFASWAPGIEVEVFPEGTGRIIPKGSKLVAQLHYTTSGKEEVDESRFGIYLQDEKPEKEYLIVGPYNPQIKVPANEKSYVNYAKETFKEPITLYGLAPHMHFRGKAMKYTAEFADGTQEVLLNVPNYNFNWQRYYVLEEPRVLPAGTSILVEAEYDNSSQNSFNPAPEKDVYWGDFSIDEMLIGYMSFHYGEAGKGEEEESLSMK